MTPPQDLPSPEQVLQPPRTKSEEDEINEEMFEGEVFAFNEDLQECMKLFEVHFGIPQILHPDFGVLTAEERAHRFKPYLFLQCMYGAFILNRAVKGKPSKGTRQVLQIIMMLLGGRGEGGGGGGGGGEVDFHFLLLFLIEDNGSYQELFSDGKILFLAKVIEFSNHEKLYEEIDFKIYFR